MMTAIDARDSAVLDSQDEYEAAIELATQNGSAH
jgi:hypothetical protein